MIHWLLLTLSCLSIVRPQYINSGGPDCRLLESDTSQVPSYSNYFNIPLARTEQESIPNEAPIDDSFYRRDDREQMEPQRKKRTIEYNDKEWNPYLVDTDKTSYINIEKPLEENSTESIDSVEKRSFSPWGGKRDRIEHMWSWKRGTMREPSMPKRVRFSPWGGKRSGQMIFKPGNKSSKIILTALAPDLTRILSSYMPRTNHLDIKGFQFIPTVDKSHPIKMLALSTNVNERTLREALPFNTFMDSIPKIFKLGHPYSEMNIKKDGKRKVKFSAWGGKRSPPIIGPIWTPATQDVKENTLNAILMLRSSQAYKDGSLGKGL